jgi:hypothetical protein
MPGQSGHALPDHHRQVRANTGREQMQQSWSRSRTYSMTSSAKYSRFRVTVLWNAPPVTQP